MKKQFTYSIYRLLLVLFFAFTVNSCQKEISSLEIPKSLDLITEAKQHFNSSLKTNELSKEILSKNEKNKFQQLNKKVLWDYAKIKKASMGEAVRIPILYDKETFIKAGKDKKSMSLYNLSYLMMYKDKKNKMQTEWVVTIPDDDYVDRKRNSGVKFTGLIHVFDWNGNLLKSYKFTKDEKIFISKNLSFNNANIKIASESPLKTNNFEHQCTTTDWYTCVGTIDAPRLYGCNYNYSTTVCEWVYRQIAPSTPDETTGGAGGAPNDYTPDDLDCQPTAGENPQDPTIAPGDGGGVVMNSTTLCSDEKTVDDKLSLLIGSNSNLNEEQKILLNEVLINLTNDCGNNYLFNVLINKPKISFNVNTSGAFPAIYNPSNNSINFKNNTNIEYNNLQEELFHAFQNYQYSGGTSQYSGNNTAGSANIEFESKIFRDINCVMRGGTCNNALGGEYVDWILSITNFGTSYPSSISTNNFNLFIGIWRSQNPGYSNTTISTTLTPIALNNFL